MGSRRRGSWWMAAALGGALTSALGCGSHVEASSAAGSGTSGNSASSAASGGAAGEGGAGGGGGAGGSESDGWLDGHYMQNTIGNCINIEEWLTFTPPAGVVETLVDRDFCGPHGVTSRPGMFGGGGPAKILDLKWAVPGQTAARSFTAAVIESYPSTPAPHPEGYEPAGGALNAMAYARPELDLVWRRTQKVVYSPDAQGKKYTTLLHIAVSFQEEPDSMKAPAACAFEVSVSASVWADEPTDPATLPDDEGSFTAPLPCSYAIDMSTPWVRLTGDGFEDSDINNSWRDYLNDVHGISDKYTGIVSSMLTEGFRPILYFEPGNSSVLFHDASFAWYPRMKSPPPASAD